MQNKEGWDKAVAEIPVTPQPPHPHKHRPDYYKRLLRDFSDAGFHLATPAMAEAYFAIVIPAEAMNGNSDWLNYIDKVVYGKTLCKMVTLPHATSWYGYATHARSEDTFEAIRNCYEFFFNGPTDATLAVHTYHVWLMPVWDNEEMASFNFEFIVGDESEVLEKLKAVSSEEIARN